VANISVTYTFSNGTVADATAVNQNFTDIINGTSDGTKDMSIAALTVAGTATLNGAVNLGNATGDDITVTGLVASDFKPKTDATYYLGSSTLGWLGAYLGRNSNRLLLQNNASASASWTFTFPVNAGVAGQSLVNQGSGTVAWKYNCIDTAAKSADYTITDTDMVQTVLMTTGASDRTVTLPTAADNIHRTITVKKVDSGAGKVIIDGEGSETIDGIVSKTLLSQYDSITIICDGAGWHITTKPIGTYLHISGTQSSITEDGTVFNVAGPMTLTEGTWLVSGSLTFSMSSGNLGVFQISLDNASNAASAVGVPNTATGECTFSGNCGATHNASGGGVNLTPYPVIVAAGATVALYLNGKVTHSQTNCSATGYASAFKVA
jgi:hypothetical protein